MTNLQSLLLGVLLIPGLVVVGCQGDPEVRTPAETSKSGVGGATGKQGLAGGPGATATGAGGATSQSLRARSTGAGGRAARSPLSGSAGTAAKALKSTGAGGTVPALRSHSAAEGTTDDTQEFYVIVIDDQLASYPEACQVFVDYLEENAPDCSGDPEAALDQLRADCDGAVGAQSEACLDAVHEGYACAIDNQAPVICDEDAGAPGVDIVAACRSYVDAATRLCQ